MAKSRWWSNKTHSKWYSKDIEGTPEQLKEAFDIMEKYTYKILSYADKEEPIPKEVVDQEKRILSFLIQGPKAGHFRYAPRKKLLSADVLYMLTSSLPSTQIGDKFNVDPRKVRQLRSGDDPEYDFEYQLVRRLKTIIEYKIKSDAKYTRTKILYSLSRVNEDQSKEILYYITSRRKARELRDSIVGKVKLKEYNKKGILDIMYPIDKIDVLT